MRRSLMVLLALIQFPFIAVSQDGSTSEGISGVVEFDGMTPDEQAPEQLNIMERQAKEALTREDYATAVPLLIAACVPERSTNCARAGEILNTRSNLDVPPNMSSILGLTACDAGLDDWCRKLDALQNEAEMGCAAAQADACYEAGFIRLFRRETQSELARGAEDYAKACDLGHRDACLEYAWMGLDGTLIERNYDLALEAFEAACDGTHPHNCTQSGLRYASPGSDWQNMTLANACFEQGCKYGDEFACANLSNQQ